MTENLLVRVLNNSIRDASKLVTLKSLNRQPYCTIMTATKLISFAAKHISFSFGVIGNREPNLSCHELNGVTIVSLFSTWTR